MEEDAVEDVTALLQIHAVCATLGVRDLGAVVRTRGVLLFQNLSLGQETPVWEGHIGLLQEVPPVIISQSRYASIVLLKWFNCSYNVYCLRCVGVHIKICN